MLLRSGKRKKKNSVFGKNRKVVRYGKQKLKGVFDRRVGEDIFAIICESKVSQIFNVENYGRVPKNNCLSSYVLLVFENHAFFKQ